VPSRHWWGRCPTLPLIIALLLDLGLERLLPLEEVVEQAGRHSLKARTYRD
jgi:hypothetical protein